MKTFATKSYDSEVPLSIQCNIKCLMAYLQDITTFIIVRCRWIKILKTNAQFVVSNPQGTQNTETATGRCFTEMVVCRKISSESNSTRNVVKILEKQSFYWFIFSCSPASSLKNKLLHNCFQFFYYSCRTIRF